MNRIWIPFTVLVLALSSCGQSPEEIEQARLAAEAAESAKLETEVGEMARGMFKPLSASADLNPDNALTPAKVKLGKVLYFDKRLSMNNKQSCNTCHNLNTYGVDNLPTSPGDAGKKWRPQFSYIVQCSATHHAVS
jgi:cytochrome c peroxidase